MMKIDPIEFRRNVEAFRACMLEILRNAQSKIEMTDAQKFAKAISLTESGGDPRAYGDGGLALTSMQVHPAFIWQWATYTKTSPRVLDSWESWVGEVVQAFYLHCVSLNLTASEAAAYYHLGHVGPDTTYVARFLTHWNAL